ncbi:MAG: hypothetical protein IKW30_06680 [Lachnospiraceae bacterium]|nr:hypothetical protein [Lachnospiraceae bacterium]
MLEKAKNIVADIKADVDRKKEEKEEIKRIQKENAERLEQQQKVIEARQEAKRLAEEEEKINVEKEKLMNLSEKELLVEAVLALRGIYSRIERLEDDYEDLEDTIHDLKKKVKSAETDALIKDLQVTAARLQK